MANQQKLKKDGSPRKETVIRAVRCPFCGAACGELCWDDEGVQMIHGVHRSRRAVFGRLMVVRGGQASRQDSVRRKARLHPAKGKPMTLAESMAAMKARNAARSK